MARPQQQGASLPDRNRVPDRDRRGGGAHQDKGACFNWNRGAPCSQTPCKFSHVCSECKGAHKSGSCPNPRERAPIPGARGPKSATSIKTATERKKDDGNASE